jgi:hypothetical protein
LLLAPASDSRSGPGAPPASSLLTSSYPPMADADVLLCRQHNTDGGLRTFGVGSRRSFRRLLAAAGFALAALLAGGREESGESRLVGVLIPTPHPTRRGSKPNPPQPASLKNPLAPAPCNPHLSTRPKTPFPPDPLAGLPRRREPPQLPLADRQALAAVPARHAVQVLVLAPARRGCSVGGPSDRLFCCCNNVTVPDCRVFKLHLSKKY